LHLSKNGLQRCIFLVLERLAVSLPKEVFECAMREIYHHQGNYLRFHMYRAQQWQARDHPGSEDAFKLPHYAGFESLNSSSQGLLGPAIIYVAVAAVICVVVAATLVDKLRPWLCL
jgi:hypothetical protein